MEFEEMQSIWDSQQKKTLYAIDETALHNRITSKKKKSLRVTNVSELLLISINSAMGVLVFLDNREDQNFFFYCFAGWMFLTALFVLTARIRRLSAATKFTHSLISDLDHTIAVASYQLRLARIMRWNNVPMALLVLLGMWMEGKPIWTASLVIFFLIVFYVSGLECNYYKSRRHDLQILRAKLGSCE